MRPLPQILRWLTDRDAWLARFARSSVVLPTAALVVTEVRAMLPIWSALTLIGLLIEFIIGLDGPLRPLGLMTTIKLLRSNRLMEVRVIILHQILISLHLLQAIFIRIVAPDHVQLIQLKVYWVGAVIMDLLASLRPRSLLELFRYCFLQHAFGVSCRAHVVHVVGLLGVWPLDFHDLFRKERLNNRLLLDLKEGLGGTLCFCTRWFLGFFRVGVSLFVLLLTCLSDSTHPLGCIWTHHAWHIRGIQSRVVNLRLTLGALLGSYSCVTLSVHLSLFMGVVIILFLINYERLINFWHLELDLVLWLGFLVVDGRLFHRCWQGCRLHHLTLRVLHRERDLRKSHLLWLFQLLALYLYRSIGFLIWLVALLLRGVHTHRIVDARSKRACHWLFVILSVVEWLGLACHLAACTGLGISILFLGLGMPLILTQNRVIFQFLIVPHRHLWLSIGKLVCANLLCQAIWWWSNRTFALLLSPCGILFRRFTEVAIIRARKDLVDLAPSRSFRLFLLLCQLLLDGLVDHVHDVGLERAEFAIQN